MTLPDKPKIKITWHKFNLTCHRCKQEVEVSLAPEFPRAWVVCANCGKTHECIMVNESAMLAKGGDDDIEQVSK